MSTYIPSMPDLSIAKPSHPPPPPRPSLAQRLRMPDQPTFRTFARLCWFDILTQLLCTGIAFLLYKFVPPLAPKWFPVFRGMETSAVGLRYGKPYLSEYVNTLVSAIVSFLGPLAVILLVGGLKVKSFWDVNSAIMALGYALATTTLFQSILKILIGGLRPHFLDVCQPPQIPAFPGQGYKNIWRTSADVCTGNPKRIREAQMSFPSGHSAAAFAGFGVLALYLNAKYKILGNHKHENIEHLEQTALPQTNADTQTASMEEKAGSKEHMRSAQGPHWKMLMFVAPWLIASALAMSKVADYWHHPMDVLAGALLGTLMAHMAYRMAYKGVYNRRVNHIPRGK